MTDFDASAHLKSLTVIPDSEIDLALSALCLSASCSEITRGKYISHLNKLVESVSARYESLTSGGGEDNIRTKLAALKHVLSDEFDYGLDKPETEAFEAADLARVIERRKGFSIAISILYIGTARRLGWSMDALSFPNYMLCRMEENGERLIIDVAQQCRLMSAPDLRNLVKKTLAPKAELSAAYFDTLSSRQILVQLQNQIKLRLIEMGDYADALQIVEKMRAIDPSEYRLFLDAGVLYAKTHQLPQAMASLELYIQKAPQGRDRLDAMQLLSELKSGLVV